MLSTRIIMFLAAVVKPNQQFNFNGVLGCWPITTQKTAQRSSKNRPKGKIEEINVTLDGALFVKMMKENLGDSIKENLCWVERVTVQLDGAGGHAPKSSIDALNQWGKQQIPKIDFILQPARSPDLNALDLGAWTSMQATVDQYKDQVMNNPEKPGNCENILIQTVKEAFLEWVKDDHLSKIFQTLQKQYQYVIEANGDVVNPKHQKKK